MTAILELGASRLEIDGEKLVASISAALFTAKQWLRLEKLLGDASECPSWLHTPFQVAQQAGARWKEIALDPFSQIVYLLVIPPKHKLVQLIQAVDWNKIDKMVAEVYENGKRGARAYAPQVLFRMLLLMALYGVCFESQLVRFVAFNIVWRWFCGFGLLTRIPTAATLCNFRKRLGPERFEMILRWLIQQCYEARLITLEEAYFDFTGVEASATRLTPYQRVVVLAKALSAYLAGIDDNNIAKDGELGPVLRRLIIEIAKDVLSEKHPSVKKLSIEQLAQSLERLDERVEEMPEGPRWWHRIQRKLKLWWQETREKMETSELLNRLATTSKETVARKQALANLKARLRDVGDDLASSVPHAWGDLSARVGTLSQGVIICGYQVGYLVDSAYNIIIGVVSMAANEAQAPQVKKVLDKTKRVLGGLPQRLGLDSAFDQDQVYIDLEDEPIEIFAVSRDHRAPKGCFGPDHFLFNASGELCCPAGTPMKQRYGPYEDGRVVYEGQGCADCDLRSQCVGEEKEFRRFSTRPESHQRWLDNRRRSQSEEGERIRKQRFAREGVFGHANTHHNGDRAPYRDGEMNAIADHLTAFAVNLEKLAAHLAAA
jgi:transposase